MTGGKMGWRCMLAMLLVGLFAGYALAVGIHVTEVWGDSSRAPTKPDVEEDAPEELVAVSVEEVVYEVRTSFDDYDGSTTHQVATPLFPVGSQEVMLVLTADADDFSACSLAVFVFHFSEGESRSGASLYEKHGDSEPKSMYLQGGVTRTFHEGAPAAVFRVGCVPLQKWETSVPVTLRATVGGSQVTFNVPEGFVEAMGNVWTKRPYFFKGDKGE